MSLHSSARQEPRPASPSQSSDNHARACPSLLRRSHLQRGRLNQKVLPPDGLLVTATCPSSFSTILRTTERPSPCPSISPGRIRVNSLNRLLRSSSLRP